MDLFDAIYRRKACRSYTQESLSAEQLKEIQSAIEAFQPLFPDVPVSFRIVSKAKGLFKVQAPHYLIIRGADREEAFVNAGFVFQQLVLWLDLHKIGSVWLGSTKDFEGSEQNDIIAIAFGKSKESVHRAENQFKRKPIQEITNDPDDVCIQAVHLAPLGMNLQPWYLEKTPGKVLLHKQSLKPPVSLLYKKTDVDLGIALCHYALACQHAGKPFRFLRKDAPSSRKGFRLFGELS